MKKGLILIAISTILFSCKLMNKEEKKEDKSQVGLPYTKFSVAEDGYGEVDGEKGNSIHINQSFRHDR
jgi:hypothetical protein